TGVGCRSPMESGRRGPGFGGRGADRVGPAELLPLQGLEAAAREFEHLVEGPHRLLVADRLAGLCFEQAVAHRGERGDYRRGE
ncbi:MAG: hypothetical protein ACXVFM_21685, partial [Solirubrobacteraceae bacterium]